ncbi:MAG: NAD(P)/FAD-dependent oxidoreductase [Candidatus Omnitrophota bacterium]
MKKDVVVIGGGAAGMFCAIQAARRGRSVLLIEHNDRIGRKIEISGGGRCNCTNLYANADAYISSNPRFCLSALARFSPQDFLALMDKRRLAWHEEKDGRIFCDDGSRRVAQMLREECESAGVEMRLNCRVAAAEKNLCFSLQTNQGTLESESLVIATGGLSFPKLGATDFAFETAQRFGLKVTELRPGLVPLRIAETERRIWSELRGTSFTACVDCGGKEFTDSVLFTHTGLSGPAILQISSYWREGDDLALDLLPGMELADSVEPGSTLQLCTLLSRYLPKRVAQKWCEIHGENRPVNQYSPKQIQAISHSLHHWRILIEGTEGYEKAEVTVGGVDTRELSPKTMEAAKVPGLFFIGEAVDATGHLGGYNFQWAWASGFAAGQFV